MPTGLYGSPQLGPYREVRPRQSAARRLAAILTLEPIWRRVVPWSRLRILLQVSTLFAWIALGLIVEPFAIRWSSSADLTTRARTFLHLEATPTFTPQQREYVASIATQQSRESAPPATAVAAIRTGLADLALVSSTCTSAGLPPITTCRGSLRNVSGRSLSGLQVTLSWSAAPGGEPQLVSSASIDLDPLLPDQTSSWTVISRYNDALRWYHTKVTDGMGDELRVRDERPAAP
jgi:hypothetical protein